MQAILGALSWEYLRRLCFPLLAACAGFIFLPWFLFRVTFALPTDAFESTQYYPSYFFLTWLMLCGCSFNAQIGLRERLFARPVSTAFVTVWLLCIPAMTAFFGHMLLNASIRFLYGAHWPWLRPALCFAVFAIVVKTMYWRLLVGKPSQIPFFAAFPVALAMAIGPSLFPDGVREGIRLHEPFSAIELLGLLGVTVLSVCIAYRTLCQARVGDYQLKTVRDFAEDLEQLLRGTQGLRHSSGQSASAALQWFYWREGTLTAVLGAYLLGGLTMVLQYLAYSNGEKLLEMTAAMLLILPTCAGMLLGISLAVSIRFPGAPQAQVMSTFLATKPVSDKALWRDLRQVLLRSSLLTWLILTALLMIIPTVSAYSGEASLWDEPRHWRGAGRIGPFGIILISPLLTWVAASTTAAIVFFGRDNVTNAVLAALLIVGTLFVLGTQMLYPEIRDLLRSVVLLSAAVAVVGITCRVFSAALSRRLIGWRMLASALLVWGLLALALYVVPEWSVATRLATVGLSLVSVISVAAAPLAISVNRHR